MVTHTLKDETTYVKNLKEKVSVFVKKREWERFHNPKDLAESICIEAAELLQIFQWISKKEALEYRTKSEKKKKIGEELADVLIYLLSLSNVMELDISQVIEDKIEKNERKYPVGKYKRKF